MKIKFYKGCLSEIGIHKYGSRVTLVFGLFEIVFISKLIRDSFRDGEMMLSRYYGFSFYYYNSPPY